MSPRPLDYASPPEQRTRTFRPKFRTAALVTAAAAALSVTGARMMPGGFFISIHANVLPAALCVVVIAFLWPSLRAGPASRRLIAACLIFAAAAVITYVLDDVLRFSLRIGARGALLGW